MIGAQPTDAERKRAAELVAQLDAAGKLADPRKALETTIAQSLASLREMGKAQKAAVPRGDSVRLKDGTVVRVEKGGATLAVFLDGKRVYSVSAPR